MTRTPNPTDHGRERIKTLPAWAQAYITQLLQTCTDFEERLDAMRERGDRDAAKAGELEAQVFNLKCQLLDPPTDDDEEPFATPAIDSKAREHIQVIAQALNEIASTLNKNCCYEPWISISNIARETTWPQSRKD